MISARRIASAYLCTGTYLLPVEISIKFIEPSAQAYDTLGDYSEKNNNWDVTISKMSDWRYSFAVLIHELIEMGLTKADGVSWGDVTKFDLQHPDYLDPGHHPEAPYHKEHMLAEEVEKHLIKMFGLDWHEYEKACDVIDDTYAETLHKNTGGRT